MAKSNKEKSISKEGMSIDEILAEVKGNYGDDSIMTFDGGVLQNIPTFSTNSPKLDKALGVGGLPRGRIVEIIGPESSGKTTIALHTIANAQKEGYKCAIVDTEHAIDPSYAKSLGVDMKKLLLSQPNCGEEALGIVETLVRTNSIGVILVDSVAALVPRAEVDGEMGDHHIGLQARLMSQALRKLTGITKKTNTLLIFTNQIRFKIGVKFGSPETTSGGNALKFYSSIRLDIRRIGTDKDKDDDAIANRVKVKVIKNKLAPPFKIVETVIRYGEGFDRISDIIDICMDKGIIKKKGSWYSYGDQQLGQGKEQVRELLIEKKDFTEQLYEYACNPDNDIAVEIKKLKKELKNYDKGSKKWTKIKKKIKKLKSQS